MGWAERRNPERASLKGFMLWDFLCPAAWDRVVPQACARGISEREDPTAARLRLDLLSPEHGGEERGCLSLASRCVTVSQYLMLSPHRCLTSAASWYWLVRYFILQDVEGVKQCGRQIQDGSHSWNSHPALAVRRSQTTYTVTDVFFFLSPPWVKGRV